MKMAIRVDKGFTLFEVLVALVVAAVALSASVKLIGQYAGNSARIQERLYGHWAASNLLVNGQLAEAWPDTDTTDGEIRFAGRDWFWRRLVTDTPYAGVRRVEVQLFFEEQDQEYVTRMAGYSGEDSPW